MHRLVPSAFEKHLDAALAGVPPGAVRKPVEIEIATELAVDAREQVLVERRGHAERVVVGSDKIRLRLHKIDTDDEEGALPQKTPGAGEELARLVRREVADGGAGE